MSQNFFDTTQDDVILGELVHDQDNEAVIPMINKPAY